MDIPSPLAVVVILTGSANRPDTNIIAEDVPTTSTGRNP